MCSTKPKTIIFFVTDLKQVVFVVWRTTNKKETI